MSTPRVAVGRVSSPGEPTALRRVSLDFEGPYRSENPQTFRDHRFDLLLEGLATGDRFTAPGRFAGDGRAGETGATSGSVWRASFAPPSEGVWRYRVRFRRGADVAVSADEEAGEPVASLDGAEGVLEVARPGRPGFTAEGSADLGGAGPFEEQEDRLVFPRIALARPRRALAAWRALLATDVFDAPALPIAAIGEIDLSSGPQASPRAVEAMAAQAAGLGAGVVRLDLFPAAAGAGAAGPWRLSPWRSGGGLAAAGAELFNFDLSRLDQWEALLGRMAARGLVVELRLDPPDPGEASALWRAPELEAARRVLLRELTARFGGLGAVIWRGGLDPEAEAYAQALDTARSPSWDGAAPAVDIDPEALDARALAAAQEGEGRDDAEASAAGSLDSVSPGAAPTPFEESAAQRLEPAAAPEPGPTVSASPQEASLKREDWAEREPVGADNDATPRDEAVAVAALEPAREAEAGLETTTQRSLPPEPFEPDRTEQDRTEPDRTEPDLPEPGGASVAPPSDRPASDGANLIESAGVAAGVATRRIGGFLRGVAHAAAVLGVETEKTEGATARGVTDRTPDNADGRGGDPAPSSAQPPEAGADVAVEAPVEAAVEPSAEFPADPRPADSRPADPRPADPRPADPRPAAPVPAEPSPAVSAPKAAEPNASAPSAALPIPAARDIPAVVDAAPALRRLRPQDLSVSFGRASVEVSLYRLDATAASPEAEPIDDAEGLDLKGFLDGRASLIARFSGADAARIHTLRLWTRRLHTAADDPQPPTAEIDPLRLTEPRAERADPFALFSNLGELAAVPAEGVTQLVAEALAEPGSRDADDADLVLRRWAAPIAGARPLQEATAGLRVATAPIFDAPETLAADPPPSDALSSDALASDPPDVSPAQDVVSGVGDHHAPDAPEALSAAAPDPSAPQTLGAALQAKIRKAPQSEAPIKEQPALSATERDGEANPSAPARARPRFGGLVSEARRRANAPVEPAAQGEPRAPKAASGVEPAAPEPVENVTAQKSTAAKTVDSADGGEEKPATAQAQEAEAPEKRDDTTGVEPARAADKPAWSRVIEPSLRVPTPLPASPPSQAPDDHRPPLALRRLELIDAETDRRIAALREGSTLSADAVLGKRLTVKATIAGVEADAVDRLRLTLQGETVAQRAIDRPQPSDGERVGLFYGLKFQEGETGVLIEALAGDGAAGEPLFSELRRFRIE